MPPPSPSLAYISNPLITSTQLLHYRSSPNAPSPTILTALFLLTQAAGILLRLPQSAIGTAIVLLQRYLTGYLPSSTTVQPLHLLSAASLYLTAKAVSIPSSPRSVINVFALLTSPTASPLPFINPASTATTSLDPSSYYITEGTFAALRLQLFNTESYLLAALGFNLHVSLPHPLALTYLSALGITNHKRLARRVIEHLNAALMSPQWLYLTCQPNVLAVGAVYLAAREVGVKLVEGVAWWECFDVGREELGFVIVGMGGVGKWGEEVMAKGRVEGLGEMR